jgi:hypothetical protein
MLAVLSVMTHGRAETETAVQIALTAIEAVEAPDAERSTLPCSMRAPLERYFVHSGPCSGRAVTLRSAHQQHAGRVEHRQDR